MVADPLEFYFRLKGQRERRPPPQALIDVRQFFIPMPQPVDLSPLTQAWQQLMKLSAPPQRPGYVSIERAPQIFQQALDFGLRQQFTQQPEAAWPHLATIADAVLAEFVPDRAQRQRIVESNRDYILQLWRSVAAFDKSPSQMLDDFRRLAASVLPSLAMAAMAPPEQRAQAPAAPIPPLPRLTTEQQAQLDRYRADRKRLTSDLARELVTSLKGREKDIRSAIQGGRREEAQAIMADAVRAALARQPALAYALQDPRADPQELERLLDEAQGQALQRLGRPPSEGRFHWLQSVPAFFRKLAEGKPKQAFTDHPELWAPLGSILLGSLGVLAAPFTAGASLAATMWAGAALAAYSAADIKPVRELDRRAGRFVAERVVRGLTTAGLMAKGESPGEAWRHAEEIWRSMNPASQEALGGFFGPVNLGLLALSATMPAASLGTAGRLFGVLRGPARAYALYEDAVTYWMTRPAAVGARALSRSLGRAWAEPYGPVTPRLARLDLSADARQGSGWRFRALYQSTPNGVVGHDPLAGILGFAAHVDTTPEARATGRIALGRLARALDDALKNLPPEQARAVRQHLLDAQAVASGSAQQIMQRFQQLLQQGTRSNARLLEVPLQGPVQWVLPDRGPMPRQSFVLFELEDGTVVPVPRSLVEQVHDALSLPHTLRPWTAVRRGDELALLPQGNRAMGLYLPPGWQQGARVLLRDFRLRLVGTPADFDRDPLGPVIRRALDEAQQEMDLAVIYQQALPTALRVNLRGMEEAARAAVLERALELERQAPMLGRQPMPAETPPEVPRLPPGRRAALARPPEPLRPEGLPPAPEAPALPPALREVTGWEMPPGPGAWVEEIRREVVRSYGPGGVTQALSPTGRIVPFASPEELDDYIVHAMQLLAGRMPAISYITPETIRHWRGEAYRALGEAVGLLETYIKRRQPDMPPEVASDLAHRIANAVMRFMGGERTAYVRAVRQLGREAIPREERRQVTARLREEPEPLPVREPYPWEELAPEPRLPEERPRVAAPAAPERPAPPPPDKSLAVGLRTVGRGRREVTWEEAWTPVKPVIQRTEERVPIAVSEGVERPILAHLRRAGEEWRFGGQPVVEAVVLRDNLQRPTAIALPLEDDSYLVAVYNRNAVQWRRKVTIADRVERLLDSLDNYIASGRQLPELGSGRYVRQLSEDVYNPLLREDPLVPIAIYRARSLEDADDIARIWRAEAAGRTGENLPALGKPDEHAALTRLWHTLHALSIRRLQEGRTSALEALLPRIYSGSMRLHRFWGMKDWRTEDLIPVIEQRLAQPIADDERLLLETARDAWMAARTRVQRLVSRRAGERAALREVVEEATGEQVLPERELIAAMRVERVEEGSELGAERLERVSERIAREGARRIVREYGTEQIAGRFQREQVEKLGNAFADLARRLAGGRDPHMLERGIARQFDQQLLLPLRSLDEGTQHDVLSTAFIQAAENLARRYGLLTGQAGIPVQPKPGITRPMRLDDVSIAGMDAWTFLGLVERALPAVEGGLYVRQLRERLQSLSQMGSSIRGEATRVLNNYVRARSPAKRAVLVERLWELLRTEQERLSERARIEAMGWTAIQQTREAAEALARLQAAGVGVDQLRLLGDLPAALAHLDDIVSRLYEELGVEPRMLAAMLRRPAPAEPAEELADPSAIFLAVKRGELRAGSFLRQQVADNLAFWQSQRVWFTLDDRKLAEEVFEFLHAIQPEKYPDPNALLAAANTISLRGLGHAIRSISLLAWERPYEWLWRRLDSLPAIGALSTSLREKLYPSSLVVVPPRGIVDEIMSLSRHVDTLSQLIQQHGAEEVARRFVGGVIAAQKMFDITRSWSDAIHGWASRIYRLAGIEADDRGYIRGLPSDEFMTYVSMALTDVNQQVRQEARDFLARMGITREQVDALKPLVQLRDLLTLHAVNTGVLKPDDLRPHYWPRIVRELPADWAEIERRAGELVWGGDVEAPKAFMLRRQFELRQIAEQLGYRYEADPARAVADWGKAVLDAIVASDVRDYLRLLGISPRLLSRHRSALAEFVAGRLYPEYIGGVLGQALAMASFWRSLKLGLDFSYSFLTGMLALGQMPAQLITGQRPAWGIAMREALNVLMRRGAHEYLARNLDEVADGILHGLLWRTSWEYIGDIEDYALSPSIILERARRAIRGVYAPFEEAFSTFQNVLGLETYKNAKQLLGLMTPAQRTEWARRWLGADRLGNTPVDEMSAKEIAARLANQIAGRQLPVGQRAKDRALMSFIFLAPRYTAAYLGLIQDAMRLGHLQGRMAAYHLAAAAGGILGLYTIAATAMGQEPQLDPRRPEFMTIRVGNTRVGFGGPLYGVGRLVMTAITEPERLLSRDMWRNPALRFLYQRFNLPITSFVDLVLTRRDFAGRPLQGGRLLEYLAGMAMPIALETALLEGGPQGALRAAVEGIGGRSFPLLPSEQLAMARQAAFEVLRVQQPEVYARYRNLQELRRYDLPAFEALNALPEVRHAYSPWLQRRLDIARLDPFLQFQLRRDELALYYRSREEELAQALQEGTIDGRTYREELSRLKAEEAAEMQGLRKALGLDRPNLAPPPGSVNDALFRYWAISPRNFEVAPGIIDWDAYFTARDQALSSLSPEDRQRVLEYIARAWSDTRRQFELQDSPAIRRYYRVSRQMWEAIRGNYPLLQDVQLPAQLDAIVQQERITGQRTPRGLQAEAAQRLLRRLVDRWRQHMRRQDPELDAALARWGFVSRTLTPEAAALAAQ